VEKHVDVILPSNYSKRKLPGGGYTEVHVGIDIKDIPEVSDADTSITINGFFLVRWRDRRLVLENIQFGEEGDDLIPVDVSLIDDIWVPDVEILNLKEFSSLEILSKLEGLWLNRKMELVYALACRIIWTCPMAFKNFPMDVQVCRFQVGSFNYDVTKIIFQPEFVADSGSVKSALDYDVKIVPLAPEDRVSMVHTGERVATTLHNRKLLRHRL